MDTIFHEKQEGSLCAQHCLNALLQGPYFTPVDLAELAQQMDDEERNRMAESGVDSEEYKRFLQQPSGNYDDSGYFSVQVISMALEVWNLELVPYNSTEPRALQAQERPADMQAYICNYRDHWFTIRRLGNQWFNLNSLLTGPELLSHTYLAMFLAQLQQEGYSIFVVFGTFPECDADNLLRLVPAVQTVKPRAVVGGKRLVGGTEEDHELQRALKLSMGMSNVSQAPVKQEEKNIVVVEEEEDDDDAELRKALWLSTVAANERLGGSTKDSELQRALKVSSEASRVPEEDEVSHEDSEDEALQRALRLSLQQDDDSEESELERAIKLSLECESPGGRVDAEEVRRKRLAYLQGRSGGSQQSIDLPSASLAESQVNT